MTPTGKRDTAILSHDGTALAGAGGSIGFDAAFAGPTPEDEPLASAAFILDLASMLDPASVSHVDFGGLAFRFGWRAHCSPAAAAGQGARRPTARMTADGGCRRGGNPREVPKGSAGPTSAPR
jgi:hypothetical protein